MQNVACDLKMSMLTCMQRNFCTERTWSVELIEGNSSLEQGLTSGNGCAHLDGDIKYHLLGHNLGPLSVALQWVTEEGVQRNILCRNQLVAWNAFTSRELFEHSWARDKVTVE